MAGAAFIPYLRLPTAMHTLVAIFSILTLLRLSCRTVECHGTMEAGDKSYPWPFLSLSQTELRFPVSLSNSR